MDDRIARLEEELHAAKSRVRANPWPWLAGGVAVGLLIGALFF